MKTVKFLFMMTCIATMLGCTEPPVQADFTNLPIIEKPNYYLVCPPGYCNLEPHEISPVFAFKLEHVLYHWQDVIKSEPRVKLVAEDKSSNQYTFVQRSKIFRFPDTINIKFIELENDHTTMAIYSQSKYGYSDLGVNEQRVQDWLDKLNLELSKHQHSRVID